MATAAPDDLFLVRRRASLDLLPPYMSELRLVLLGNSWSVRSSVGNFILGETVFNTERELVYCQAVRGQIKDKPITIINTPDLLSPYISENKLKDYETDCVRLSDPGPHVFLLVLQPEDFTEEQKLRLCSVLKCFSDRSFDHSLILISAQRGDSQGSGGKYTEHSALTHMIKICRSRFLKLENLELSQLQKHLGEITRANDGEHVSCGATQRGAQGCFPETVKPVASGLRIVLLGKSENEQTRLGNFIIRGQAFNHQKTNPTRQCLATLGEWNKEPLTVVKTPDLFSLNVEDMGREVKSCVSLCSPRPNVLLLLVKPSEFSEENRETLKIILSLFGQDAYKHSLLISTDEGGKTEDSFRRLLRDCAGRHYSMSEDNHRLLMEKIQETAGRTKPPPYESKHMKPLNLVLCGRRGAAKSSAAEAILGQTGLHSASRSSECVKHQGKVCGRWVSLVNLPALSGKPLETVMKESLRSVSLCDPAGVHAFVLVLPVGPLTDEDKKELKIIQETFSPRVNDFTMILFITESDPTDPAVVNFVEKDQDTQRLVQSCGGRHYVLNIEDQRQIPELLDMVEKMQPSVGPRSYTSVTCAHTEEVQELRTISTTQADPEDLDSITSGDVTRSSERLRIVLIGITGSGKSSSGNTILGRKEFKAEAGQISVTRDCQKAYGEVDGRPVAVVDTPGLFDTTLSNEEIREMIKKCFSLLAPGPHVLLLVLQIGRYTEEEREALKVIKEGLGMNVENHTIILFTGGDTLEHHGLSIEEYVKEKCKESFKKLVTECGNRYHMFNNFDKQNRQQVSELIAKIDTMVEKSGGNCYTNKMLQEADNAIKREVQRILEDKEEEMQEKLREIQKQHEEEIREMESKMELQSEVNARESQRLREKMQMMHMTREEERYDTGPGYQIQFKQERETRVFTIDLGEKTKRRKGSEKKLRKAMDDLRRVYEEEARKNAEESNEFGPMYITNDDLEAARKSKCVIL